MRNKERQKEAQRRWYQLIVKPRREQWLKEHGPCVKCGTWKNLEVDHIDPATKLSHNIWSWSEQRRIKELAKCQVLCFDCHLKKTIEYTNKMHPLVHGTLAAYKSKLHNCKCLLCKKANADWKDNNQRKKSGSGQAGKAPDLGSGNTQVRTLSPRPF